MHIASIQPPGLETHFGVGYGCGGGGGGGRAQCYKACLISSMVSAVSTVPCSVVL